MVLVTGRVWARGGGRVVDSSTGWLFKVRDGRIARARVFESAHGSRGGREDRLRRAEGTRLQVLSNC